ncbi:MFS transporter [Clostridium sp. Marseille-Q7071]
MTQEVKTSQARAYAIEAIIFLSYMFFSVSWLAGSKVTPEIMKAFNLDSLPSAVTNAITISKIIGNLVAAWFLMKLGPKKAIGLSTLLISVVGLGAFATNFPFFIITRFIMGFGGALLVVYFGPIVMHYFEPEKRPLLNGLNSVANNIGNIVALLMVDPIIKALGNWKAVVLVFAGISLLLFILWMIIGKDFVIASKSSTNEKSYGYKEGLKDKFNYIFAFAYSGWLTLYIVMLNLFPLNDAVSVNPSLLSTLLAVAGVVATPFGIMLAKKSKKKLPVVKICGILTPAVALLMVLTNSSTIAIVSSFILGFLIFLPMTTFVTIPQQLKGMTPQRLTVVMGMFWSISYIVETILYTIITKVVNSSGFQPAMYLSIACSLTFVICGFLLPETGADINK